MGSLVVWPVARPEINLESGEVFKFSLRIRPLESAPLSLQLFTESTDQLKVNLRKERDVEGYWLDMQLGPMSEPGTRTIPVLVTSGTEEVTIQVEATVVAEGLVVTPATLDMGEVSHAALKDGSRRLGRFGVRKPVGIFQIKSISTTLPFLTLEKQVITEGTNYVIRVVLETKNPPKIGAYNGVIKIVTDDPRSPVLEVPVKLTIIR